MHIRHNPPQLGQVVFTDGVEHNHFDTAFTDGVNRVEDSRFALPNIIQPDTANPRETERR